MDEKKLKALAAELAKGLKKPAGPVLARLSREFLRRCFFHHFLRFNINGLTKKLPMSSKVNPCPADI
ncbi:hypothetical protein [Enterobacillus tribolii]|uniref:Uncharacterized protein n=1 Tax=Enterobacillus tribolii TaxID=1487935 RepID=A0A370QUB7_9GAMM|nr:hypothetical protein [Enterobacillus tribolii]MBW7981091.1 hypothetical protein [Enterobacillus tribolii]RDK92852.1 hypothetical protein C8D90_103245 [Enterobacillus tribolii]